MIVKQLGRYDAPAVNGLANRGLYFSESHAVSQGSKAMPARRQLPKDPNLDAFPENLVRLRKQRGLSQAELAVNVGIAQPNISDYERGNVRPSMEIFVGLVRALDVSADEILGFEPSRHTVVKDRRLAQQIAQIEHLPRRDRDALLRTIRMYVDRAQ